jgi:hypothetical protein
MRPVGTVALRPIFESCAHFPNMKQICYRPRDGAEIFFFLPHACENMVVLISNSSSSSSSSNICDTAVLRNVQIGSGAHQVSISFPEIKRPALEVNHSLPFSAGFENVWSYTTHPPYAMMALTGATSNSVLLLLLLLPLPHHYCDYYCCCYYYYYYYYY